MERCASCGAGLSPEAAWCGQCFARVPAAVGAPGAGGFTADPGRFAAAPPTVHVRQPEATPAAYRYTRWRKTATTFGPLGRVLCTLALVLPFGFLVGAGLLTFDPFVLGGAAVWGVVLMPWGLRDTWRAGRLPVR